MSRNLKVEQQVKEQFVGKVEELTLTQFAFDLKVEDMSNGERKVVVHGYSNDKAQLVKDVAEIYKSAHKVVKTQ